MDGSSLLQMNLRSGRGSTSSGAASEGHGDSARAFERDDEGAREVPPLVPHPFPPPPPPPPLSAAEVMVELLAARQESAAARQETARAMEIMAQAVAGLARGGPGGNGGNGGGARRPEGQSSYQDFLKTHPPTFTLLDDPLEAEHWLRMLEQKFRLLGVANEQKVHFASQQLLGSAGAWWETFLAAELPDHPATWQEFSTAFREFFIPAGVIHQKVTEFMELRQGSRTVMEYVTQFNHLAQYAGSQVDTDDKKKDRFFRGLTPALQEKLYLGNYQTFGALMNAAIALEGFQRASQADWKRRRVAAGSSSHPHTQKVQIVRRGPYQPSGGPPYRSPQQTSQTSATQYKAPPQQVQPQQTQGQQFPPR